MYLRLPDGFISIANRTISSRPSSSRCRSSFTNSQIVANLSKSVFFDDINGYVLKCGSTFATKSLTFRISNLSVLSDLSGRNESASPLLLNYVEQFGSVRVLADRKTRSNLPTEAMTLARLERKRKNSLLHLRNQRCKNLDPSAKIRAGVLWNLSIPSKDLNP